MEDTRNKIVVAICSFLGFLVMAAPVIVFTCLELWDIKPAVATGLQGDTVKKIQEANVDIMVYGDGELPTDMDITCRRLSELKDVTLGADGIDRYHVLVLFDIDGRMRLSEDDLHLIYGYIYDRHYDLFYIGNAHMEQFRRCGYDLRAEDLFHDGFWYHGYKPGKYPYPEYFDEIENGVDASEREKHCWQYILKCLELQLSE